jgi:hypothetical protein
LEKEQCVAEAEKFIAEFYRHKFIKPTPKNYKFNHVVDFQAAFSRSYLRFFAKYACPGSHALSPFFEHPFARLGCFGRDRWNLWARRHNDEWICIKRRLQTLRECFQSMRENPWFHFWMSCVLRLHFGLMIRRLTTLASAGRPTEGLFRVRTSSRAIRKARARKALTSFCY